MESRPKAGHHGAGGGSGHEDPGGHQLDVELRHRQMVEAIRDCQVVIVGGMGRGAKAAMLAASITPCSTEETKATEAVKAFLADDTVAAPECHYKMPSNS